MYKINLKRNEKCLCGSGLKFKKCCLNKNIMFSQITDLDFRLVFSFNNSIPLKKKSLFYNAIFNSILDLEKTCIDYKSKTLEIINENSEHLYKYIFKNLDNEELYLCGLEYLGESSNIKETTVEENIKAASIMISKLKENIILNQKS